jgi:hypothetical protein
MQTYAVACKTHFVPALHGEKLKALRPPPLMHSTHHKPEVGPVLDRGVTSKYG